MINWLPKNKYGPGWPGWYGDWQSGPYEILNDLEGYLVTYEGQWIGTAIRLQEAKEVAERHSQGK